MIFLRDLKLENRCTTTIESNFEAALFSITINTDSYLWRGHRWVHIREQRV